MRFFRTFVLVAGAAAFFGGEAFAQREGRRGFASPDAFFDRLDQNGNGTIDPDEVPERMRPFLERMGVEATQPLTRESFSQSFQRAREQSGGRRGEAQDRSNSDASPQAPRGMVTPNQAAGNAQSTPERGDSQSRRRGRSGRFRGDENSDSTSGDRPRRGRFGDGGDDPAERTQQFTQRILDRYDRNSDGVLASDEAPEWLSQSTAQLDANQDGILDAEELGSRFRQRWGSRESSPSQDSATAAQSGLPVGLPAWFQETDQNHDSQIGFYEWERSRAAEFLEMDANNDGFLTPEEALAANRPSTGRSGDSRGGFASQGRNRQRFFGRR